MKEEFQTQMERVCLDDRGLMMEIEKTQNNVLETKEFLDAIQHKNETNDYIHIKLAKLAYGFAHERYENLSKEAEKRGLLISPTFLYKNQ